MKGNVKFYTHRKYLRRIDSGNVASSMTKTTLFNFDIILFSMTKTTLFKFDIVISMTKTTLFKFDIKFCLIIKLSFNYCFLLHLFIDGELGRSQRAINIKY